jgi:hypothetical protein
MIALAGISAAVAGKLRIEGLGWIEPLNLYVVVSAESGTRKSIVVKHVSAPIEKYEAERIKTDKPVVVEAQAQRESRRALPGSSATGCRERA